MVRGPVSQAVPIKLALIDMRHAPPAFGESRRTRYGWLRWRLADVYCLPGIKLCALDQC